MRSKRYREKRPQQRLGCMQIEKTRHSEPAYKRTMVTLGLVQPTADLMTAWGRWQSICADPEVRKLCMAHAAKKEPVYLVSVTAPFHNGVCVLHAMNQKQLDALRERIGVK
jgi:hypothetical protein